jgi:hypothetical protein
MDEKWKKGEIIYTVERKTKLNRLISLAGQKVGLSNGSLGPCFMVEIREHPRATVRCCFP